MPTRQVRGSDCAALAISETFRNTQTQIERSSLLFPWVTFVVISDLFPVSQLIFVQELDPINPFCALPEVELRHYQSKRPAMFGQQRQSIMRVREQNTVIEARRQGQI